MSKSISYSNHNISTTQDHSNNALSTFFNTSKIYKKEDNNQTHYKKLKMISLNSTPNTLNNKNLNSFCCATINNTFSNERKENKKNTIPMSLSGKSSKRFFSVSQGYPKFSKSFNKKYNTKGYCVNYLEQKDNKYIGIDLNLVSNSSRKKKEKNEIYKKGKVGNNNDIDNDNDNEELFSPRNKENEIENVNDSIKIREKDNSSCIIYEDCNEDKKNNENASLCKNKKIELNSSVSSHIRQNSHLENASVNQSTPVSSFHPYEADSSPTNYIKSYSNINNLTYLTNNNSKKCNKNDDEDEKRSVSHFGFNQSEFTCFNNSNKISEKEEEKRIYDKLEKMSKNRKNKNNKKRKKIIDNISNDNANNENINLNESFFNNNENNIIPNTIEEKEEEYLNSMNNKLIISKEQDTIYHLKKTEENEKEKEKEEIEKEEKKLMKKLEEEKEINKKEEERILFLEKENQEKELKQKELNEIKDIIKKEQIYRKSLEKKAKLLEMKLKNEEIKNIYNEDNVNNNKKNINNLNENRNQNIEVKDTNFMNNVNQVTFNAPKSTINAKLNFNYFTGIQNEIEKPINFINNLKESKNDLKQENSSNSYFYDYGSNTIINTGIFNAPAIKENKTKNSMENNKIEKNYFIIKKNKSNIMPPKIINPQKQFELEIKSEENNKKNNNITFTSFNFGLLQNNNKRKMIKKSLMNNNINILQKENKELNYQNSFNNIINNIKDPKEKTLTKDASTQYNQEIFNKTEKNKSTIFLRNYMTNSGKNENNFLKTDFKHEFLNKTKSELFNLESFKTSYKINNFPHHNKIGRNKGTIWKEYTINNSKNSKGGKTEENYGFIFINKYSKNKFNRKINSFVFPANPFDSVNKAREYYFFNN